MSIAAHTSDNDAFWPLCTAGRSPSRADHANPRRILFETTYLPYGVEVNGDSDTPLDLPLENSPFGRSMKPCLPLIDHLYELSELSNLCQSFIV